MSEFSKNTPEQFSGDFSPIEKFETKVRDVLSLFEMELTYEQVFKDPLFLEAKNLSTQITPTEMRAVFKKIRQSLVSDYAREHLKRLVTALNK